MHLPSPLINSAGEMKHETHGT